MNRSAFAPALTLLLTATVLTTAFAQQAQPAATTGTPSAPVKAKFASPIKGDVKIQVIQGESKFIGKEIVTTYKIKNMASGPIAMLKIDEYWYDKGAKTIVTTDTKRHKQPFQPGEVIEITTRAPRLPGAARSQAQFSHANGKVTVQPVKKFD